MAKNKSTVYLGFDDEEVTIKNALHLDSKVNKIGGLPDWPSSEINVPACQLCGTMRPLILQLYAPLDHSQFHRTLYLFACLNPACSPNSKSWLCVRTQHLDTISQAELISAIHAPTNLVVSTGGKNKAKKKQSGQKISWCRGADDWGEAEPLVTAACEQMDTSADDELQNEENGNIMVLKNVDNAPLDLPDAAVDRDIGNVEASIDTYPDDDDDDDSTSMDNELVCGFVQLDMNSPQNAASTEEDPNANCAAAVAAVGGSGGDSVVEGVDIGDNVYAEIEGGETDVVHVETPKKPERDLIALLKHTSTPAALGPMAKITDVTLKSYFIAVDLEQNNTRSKYEGYGGDLSEDHIRELYQEYKRQDEATLSPCSVSGIGENCAAVGGGTPPDEKETYEQAKPPHGDMIFHNFISTIQRNPGQLLRYSRDTLPLLIAPLTEPIPKCPNCNGETICEVQVLSTLIPKLRLQQNGEPTPIEYGNVLIFTCLKSCWDTPDKMRYERVLVQAEL